MSETKFKFEDLKVYQKALDFVDFTYKVSSGFPKTERYALSHPFTRAAVFVALNITEGSGHTNALFNRFFLQVAKLH
ncbi:MAG: four helix bundle protein [Flavobacteriaceae bacterium]|nr:four helix bundle protein [Flavobacteriaceae bacterium]